NAPRREPRLAVITADRDAAHPIDEREGEDSGTGAFTMDWRVGERPGAATIRGMQHACARTTAGSDPHVGVAGHHERAPASGERRLAGEATRQSRGGNTCPRASRVARLENEKMFVDRIAQRHSAARVPEG